MQSPDVEPASTAAMAITTNSVDPVSVTVAGRHSAVGVEIARNTVTDASGHVARPSCKSVIVAATERGVITSEQVNVCDENVNAFLHVTTDPLKNVVAVSGVTAPPLASSVTVTGETQNAEMPDVGALT